MTTARFSRLASPTAQAMAKAYELARDGTAHGRFPCTAPRCGGVIEFTAKLQEPHKSAGSCKSPNCVRWAQQ